MPNHVTNIMTLDGNKKSVAKLMKTIYGGIDDEAHHKYIDFNNVIPQPKGIEIDAGSVIEIAAQDFIKVAGRRKKKIAQAMKDNIEVLLSMHPSQIEMLKKYLENYVKTGHTNWYDWRISKWGTKWNAYNQSQLDSCRICFDTAWSTPRPVVKKLSKMFPSIQITIEYADEEIGHNCGRYVFENGHLVEEYYPDDSEAEGFALAIKNNLD